MRNINLTSQSTEAINSATINFSNNASNSKKIEVPVLGFSRDSIITFVGCAVNEMRKDVSFCGWIKGGKSIEVHFTKNYFSKNYEVMYTIYDDGKVNMEKSGVKELGFKVLSGSNINEAVGTIVIALEELVVYYVEDINSEKVNDDAVVSETPISEVEDCTVYDTPMLNDAPMLETETIYYLNFDDEVRCENVCV